MQDTAKAPRKPEDRSPGRRPLVDEQLADQLLGKARAEGVELLGPDGLLSQVTKAVLERALAEEMTGHLGYEKHDPAGRGSGNNRNGTTGKTVLTDIGAVDLAVPRDRNGTFEPQVVRKGQARLKGFNERIIPLYGRGMTTRDIRAHLREIYDVDVSPDLISRVPDVHAGPPRRHPQGGRGCGASPEVIEACEPLRCVWRRGPILVSLGKGRHLIETREKSYRLT